MADAYTTVAALRSAMAIPAVSGDADAQLLLAIEAASRAIDEECDRFFYDAGSATARTFDAHLCRRLDVADFHTTAGLIVLTDDNDDGVYETTWTVNTDFVVEPLVPSPGWPWHTIRAVGTRTFPTRGYRPRVQVTARWGWAAVPPQIELATQMLAQKLWDRRNSVQGVLGFGDAGFAVRIARTDPDIGRLISPFDTSSVVLA